MKHRTYYEPLKAPPPGYRKILKRKLIPGRRARELEHVIEEAREQYGDALHGGSDARHYVIYVPDTEAA